MRKATVVIDLQFGSTGKGLIAGYLAQRDKPDTVCTAWAANAGHTFVDADGRTFIHTMLANGVVSPNLQRIMIGPGSVIDPDNLFNEIITVMDLLGGVEIYIHANAAIITQEHRDEEAGPMTKIGSTKKGCGAAAIHRIRRNPDNMNTADAVLRKHRLMSLSFIHIVTPEKYAEKLDKATNILIEGAQGHSLSMYHGFYPYTTSRDVSLAQVLADVGVPARGWAKIHVVGTARTFPIRVANRFDENGNQVGWSGPAYDDQKEVSFEDIGQKVELTTVTKLPRRIFTFSMKQIKEAVRQNGVDEIFLNFVNYLNSVEEIQAVIDDINLSTPNSLAIVRYIGWGPKVTQVGDLDKMPAPLGSGVDGELMASLINTLASKGAVK